MGYRKIPNLYKNQKILLFKECFALEKIHGTSTHISWRGSNIHFYSGGLSQEDFTNIFDEDDLACKFAELGNSEVTIFGEGYGGKCQRMEETYGDDYRFVAFEVKIGKCWLNVENAYDVAHNQMGLDFVPFRKIPCDMEHIDEQMLLPSEQSEKLGVSSDAVREGVVLRPPVEVRCNNGERIMAKHKNKQFHERSNQPNVSPDKLEVTRNAEKVAAEWVNEMRLSHVLDSFDDPSIEDTGDVIKAMIEDVLVEAEGEISYDNERDLRKAIGSRTAEMFHRRIK
jgi:hypothetical protein